MAFFGTSIQIPQDAHADSHNTVGARLQAHAKDDRVAALLRSFGWDGQPISSKYPWDDQMYLATHLSPAGGRSMMAHLVSALYTWGLIGRVEEPAEEEPLAPGSYPGAPKTFRETIDLLESVAITLHTAGPSEKQQWASVLWALRLSNEKPTPAGAVDFYSYVAAKQALHRLPALWAPDRTAAAIAFRALEEAVGKWGISVQESDRIAAIGAYTQFEAVVYPPRGTEDAAPGTPGAVNPRIVIYRSRRAENEIMGTNPWMASASNAAKALDEVANQLGLVSRFAGWIGSTQALQANDYRAALGLPLDHGTGGGGGFDVGGGARL